MDKQDRIKMLEGLGGNLWEKYGHCRVYFEGHNIASSTGMEWNVYGTGNISSARYDGEKISNSAARSALSEFNWFKIWYDLNKDQLCLNPVGRKESMSNEISSEMMNRFRAKIKEMFS